MTQAELFTQLTDFQYELHRLTLAIEEALRPVRSQLLLSGMTRLENRLDELIEALPTLEEEAPPDA